MTIPSPRTSGLILENTLHQVHDLYRRDGLARLHHQGTIATPHKDREIGGIAWRSEKSRPDYCGWTRDGSARHIEFDAKHWHGGKRYHHDKRRSHQLMALWDVYEDHGIAGILVANLDEGWGFWVVPQPEWNVGQFSSVKLEESDLCLVVPSHPGFWGGEYYPDWFRVAAR